MKSVKIPSSISNPFLPLAKRICDKWQPEKRQTKICRDLEALGTGRKNCIRSYYETKLARMMLIACAAIVILICCLAAEHGRNRSVAGGLLERPGYGEQSLQQSLNLTVSGEAESEAFDIRLSARSYSAAQAQALLRKADAELTELLPGGNPDLDCVRSALSRPARLQNGAVSAEYYISPAGIVEEDGSILPSGQLREAGEKGVLIRIQAVLTCQDRTRTVELSARVLPPLLSGKEALLSHIQDAVDRAQSEDPEAPQVRLPDSVDGRTLIWTYPQSSVFRIGVLLLLLVPLFFWAHADSRVHDEARERTSQLDLDYSEVLWKLTMLLSAGLTIRGAFTRIGAQYTRQKQQKRYVYEEMLLTLREMKSGVPEASAYENFGRRCGLSAYIKLGSLLAQNLKKGSKGLTSLLETEAVRSMEQHRMAVKKLGEKAAVKMLLPMILMFGVVLIILMVPAFLSM